MIAVLAWSRAIAYAGFDEGKAAYDKGDYAKAYEEFKTLAEQENGDAQNDLGYMYYAGHGVSKDYAEAIKWYRKAADQGHALGQYNLGVMYDKGLGVPKEYDEAVSGTAKRLSRDMPGTKQSGSICTKR